MITSNTIRKYIVMSLGVFLVAVDVHLFKTPNRFAFGGVSGFSIVLANVLTFLDVGDIMLILNTLLLIVGFAVLGKSFGGKTVYCTLLLSVLVSLLSKAFPIDEPLTDQKMLEFLYAVFLPGIGSAVVFYSGGTTGGTDIIAKIISKYSHMKIGSALMMADFFVVLVAGFVYGVETFLFAAAGVIIKSFALDSILESFKVFKIVVIISEEPEPIKEFICCNLDRSATVHFAKGAYRNDEREVITTVLSRRQAIRLQTFIKERDPHAFITLSNSSHIIGNGFMSFD